MDGTADAARLNGGNAFLATTPAPGIAKRRALAICAVAFAGFCTLIPFVRVLLPRIEAFVPIYETMFALNCLMTGGVLFAGFSRSRLRAVLVLATAYLFTSLAAVVHMMTLPGLFSRSGLLGAGPETSVWIDAFRFGGLPLGAIDYALLTRRDKLGRQSPQESRAKIIWAGAIAVGALALLTGIATADHLLLPQVTNSNGYTSAGVAVHAVIWLLSLVALVALGVQPRYSILDLWLLVVVWIWMFGLALCMVLNTEPFDVGFYAGRVYCLIAVCIAPIVLLIEASRLARRLDHAIALAEQRNLELARSRGELAQAQRLEAIGQLTGGVAHDFNNLLTVVIGNLELILGARGARDKIERLAQSALKAAHRGEHLVQQLLTYARRQISNPQTVDLNRLVTDIESLIHRVIGEQIEVITTLSQSLAPVQIDQAQFETALLNLAINSRDAMPGGGRITIETRNVTLERKTDDTAWKPGLYAMVAVSDNGTGMTPEVLARAFDPFFTTKEVGKGSGLGLSQVYGFVNAAGGHVEITSKLGSGTTVTLYLPQSSNSATVPRSAREGPPSRLSSSRGTVLVVEDDEDVLAVTAESLREFGYQVITAVNAAGALEILRSDQPVDLLFSDIVIPGGTDGVQLAEEARYVRPGLKVILTSGYAAAALNLEHGAPLTLEVLGKPYQRGELAKKLRQVMDE